MPSKLQFYQSVAEQAAHDVTAGHGKWMGFLDAAARMYKYPFPDQLLIHAQKPDAIACASIETWNDKFSRWVIRGTKGIALIDDSGSYPILRYVFDVNDTVLRSQPPRFVYLWEMQEEHKELVLEALGKSYEDVSDNIEESFYNIARQLAREYYEDNAREIRFCVEGSALEALDDMSLGDAFEEALTNSIAYTLMSRCGFNAAEYFDEDDFRNIHEFNTPDMVYALGTATNELSAQVLRDIEIPIKKYERLKAAEREENERTHVHAGRGLPPAEHQAERTAEGIGGAVRELREDAESISQGTSENNLQPNVIERNAVPAPSGNRGSGEQAHGTVNETPAREEPAPEQGSRPDGLGSGNELNENAGQRNGAERTDIRGLSNHPTSPPPVFVVDWKEAEPDFDTSLYQDRDVLCYDKDGVKHAVGKMGNVTYITSTGAFWGSNEVPGFLYEQIQAYRDGEVTAQQVRDNYLNVLQAFKENQPENVNVESQPPPVNSLAHETPPTPPPEPLTNPISETLSTSSITLDEVDSILRDGGYSFNNNRTSILRIAAHFAKDLSHKENAAFLRHEYLVGPQGREETPGGKGYLFGTQQTSIWFNENGITIGRGKSALHATDYALITWEQAAERIKQLYETGQYVSHDVLDEALYNESKERAGDIIEVYKNLSRGLSDIKWELRKHMDEAQIKALESGGRSSHYLIYGLTKLESRVNDAINGENKPSPEKIMQLYNEAIQLSEEIPKEWGFDKLHPQVDEHITELLRDKGQVSEYDKSRGITFSESGGYAMILNRLKKDVAALKINPDIPIRFWRSPYRALDNLEKAGIPPKGFPPAPAKYQPLNFMRLITDDEVDNYLTRGGSYSESKMGILSHFLHDHTPKERTDFMKSKYGQGGGSWVGGGWANYEPGKGITLQRPGCDDVSLNWNQAVKRTQSLIESGQFCSRAELGQIPQYERLMLAKAVNNFFRNLPEEYERPFSEGLDFSYAKGDEWAAINELLDNPEKITALLGQMKYIYENTPEEDRYYHARKVGYERLSAYHEGTYTLFPGLERLPDPEAAERPPSLQAQRRGRAIDTRNPQQMTINDFGAFEFEQPPILPSAEEQQAKIDYAQRREREQKQEQTQEGTAAGMHGRAGREASDQSEANAPAVSFLSNETALSNTTDAPITQAEIDALLLTVASEDKQRLAAQFTSNPRSREAVALVREIYSGIEETLPKLDNTSGYLGILSESTGVAIVRGAPGSVPLSERPTAETLSLPWAAVIKRVSELAETGQFAITQEQPAAEAPITERKPTLYEEYLQLKAEYPNDIIMFQVGDFMEFYNEDAETAARVLGITVLGREVEGQTERIKFAGIPMHTLSDNVDALYNAGHGIVISSLNSNGSRSVLHTPQEDELGTEITETTVASEPPTPKTSESNQEITVVFTGVDGESDFFPIGEIISFDEAAQVLDNASEEWHKDINSPLSWKVFLSFRYRNDNGDLCEIPFRCDVGEHSGYKGLFNTFKEYWERAESRIGDPLREMHTADEVAGAKEFIEMLEEDMARTAENVTVTPLPEIEPESSYKIGDKLEYNGKPHEIVSIDRFVRLHNLVTVSHLPIFDYVSIMKQDFEDMLSDGRVILTPEQEIPAPQPFNLDFDTVAQAILGRVVQNEDYIKHLAEAGTSDSLRDYVAWLIEQTIRDHEEDEPEMFKQLLSAEGFSVRERLQDYVLTETWANRAALTAEFIAQAVAKPVNELNFDTVAQTVLERVKQDADYIENLSQAKTRASLRNPVGWAVEQFVRDHEDDEPQIFERYFSSSNEFRDRLQDFVLRETWADKDKIIAAFNEQSVSATEPIAESDTDFDFDKAAQTVLAGVMRDTDYLQDLSEAETRISLSNRTFWAVEKFIRDHKEDEPEIFEQFIISYSNDDYEFQERLTDFVLHEIWTDKVTIIAAFKEQSESVTEAVAEPAAESAAELDFNTVAQNVMARVMEDSEFSKALDEAWARRGIRNALNVALEIAIYEHQEDEPQVYRAFVEDEDFSDRLFDYLYQQTWETKLAQQASLEQAAAADVPEQSAAEPQEAAKPTADRLASIDGTDYYLFHVPENSETPAELSVDTLSLITERADKFVICADVCYLSDSEMKQWNIEFLKMALDYGKLPIEAQKKIGEIRPDIAASGLRNQIYDELFGRGFRVPIEIINDGISRYRGSGDFQDIADFIESELIIEEPELDIDENEPELADEARGNLEQADIRRHAIPGDSVYYRNKLYQVDSIDDSSVYLIDPGAVLPLKMHVFRNEFNDILTGDPRNAHLLPFSQRQVIAPALTQQQKPPHPRRTSANFRITDDHLGEGGAKTKFRYNIEAIKTLKNIESENRTATPEEQEILSRYVGWGSLQQAFDPSNRQWEKEHAELNALLSLEEFRSARATTINAHYTTPTVIKAIYETVERMGFKSGNILEPSCGIGNFFGLLPESMSKSKLYGVEIDGVSTRIAKHLYPNANIQESGYEKTEMPDAFFDLAIGNVPFGDYSVADKRYDKHKFRIHDYFFAKTLDQVRPGGVIAFVTSKGTLDKVNPTVRKYLAQRAELLGAVRLPNNAFMKNAGTQVTADIIFLQKRERPMDIEPDWVQLGYTDDGLPINRYFADNPEMVLGTMANDDGVRMYGSADSTTCLPFEGADLAEQLREALLNIEGEITEAEIDDIEGIDNHAIPADPRVKNFSYALVTPDADGGITAASITAGQVYFRENSLMYTVDLPATTLERIKGMIALRDCTHQLIALQVDEQSEAEVKAKQAELNALYDSFTAEYGLINSTANSRAFNADNSYYLLSSLEILDEDNKLKRKADMFTKRTIKPQMVITRVDTASEALAVSLDEKGFVDIDYMANLTGFSRDKVIADLQGVIFLNIGSANDQQKTYVTADEYLSGNVREKLEQAKAAQATINDGSFDINVQALEAVQPKPLEAHEISLRLGSTWIDKEYVQQFLYHLLPAAKNRPNDYIVNYSPRTSDWQVTGRGKAALNDIHASVTYGTSRMNAYEIIHETLNLKDARVYDYEKDGEGKPKRTLNKKETALAQQKQELIKQQFKDWIWNEPERRQALVKLYNEKFNSTRPREFDGSHLTFPGMSPEVKLRPHQINSIARIMYGGNTLLAHVVGAGKTFSMTAAAMEMKRIGLCHKSLIAVPNHLTEQWAAEFLRLYPAANILVAKKRDFEMRNRKKFCAKIATGDYDAVIMGHSQLKKIPLSKERQQRILVEQIEEIEAAMAELANDDDEIFTVKRMERTKKSLEVHLEKLLDAKKKDDIVTFEQLGVDRLFVDESHSYKNLFMFSKMRNVAGLSSESAQKAIDLFTKTRYMDELTGYKGNIHATGTPVTNSLLEIFTNQRYLQYDTLSEQGLGHCDAWVSTFAEPQTTIELAPEGTGYRARTRLAKFHNLPELMAMFKEFADIQTADMLDLPTPEVRYENIILEPSELQKAMVEDLSERASLVQGRQVDPKQDNMLKITTDGRKIGLDQRLMNPLLPESENNKSNACANKIFDIWEEAKEKRLTQLVFCDYSTPKNDGTFDIYNDIKKKLIDKGIPEHEIAFIHDHESEARKKDLFAKVRQGRIRILFGSTAKMGAGTNVQDKLVANHDVDCPWRPADLEQRSGRIARQGNNNPEVAIYRYATQGTFDSYLWQTVEVKQKFISQIISSKSPARSCEDIDETALSYAEIKALCAGNPKIAEKMNLDVEVAKLRMVKSEFLSQKHRLEDDLLQRYPKEIVAVTERIAGIERDIAAYSQEAAKLVSVQTGLDGKATSATTAAFSGMTIKGITYAEKEPAAKALLEACKLINSKEEVNIGNYMGFLMSLSYDSYKQTFNLLLRGSMTYQAELGTDAFGNITRINNVLEGLPKRLEGAKNQLENLHTQQELAKEELKRPFALADELAEKEARLALLDAELNIEGKGGSRASNNVNSREDDFKPPDDGRSNQPGNYQFSRQPEGQIPQRHWEHQQRQAASAKSGRPSFLDEIREYNAGKNGGKQQSAAGKKKPVIDI